MINTIKLKAKIFENGYNIDRFAETIGMSATTLRKKVKGKTDFQLGETISIKKKLGLNTKDYIDIFFGNELEL